MRTLVLMTAIASLLAASAGWAGFEDHYQHALCTSVLPNEPITYGNTSWFRPNFYASLKNEVQHGNRNIFNFRAIIGGHAYDCKYRGPRRPLAQVTQFACDSDGRTQPASAVLAQYRSCGLYPTQAPGSSGAPAGGSSSAGASYGTGRSGPAR